MKNDPRYSTEVKIEKIKEKTGRTSVKNPHSVSNVNVAQGPRTGNVGDMAKRRTFQANKAEAAPLAAVIQRAYGDRKIADNTDAKYEGISPNTKPRSRSR